MLSLVKRWVPAAALCGLALAVAAPGGYAAEQSGEAAKKPQVLKSGIVRFDDAESRPADWGEFHRYFGGETFGTKNVLTAVAVVEPGKAVHRAHRHAEEEYLAVLQGSGTWSLDGKEVPAQRGGILYVEPWVYHGLTNTGTEKLIFLVVRYTSKGIEPPPKPDDRPNEL